MCKPFYRSDTDQRYPVYDLFKKARYNKIVRKTCPHYCGNSAISIIDSILRTGAKVLHFGNAIDMREMLKHVPEDIVVMGNIDPAGEFRNGTSESMNKAVKTLLADCSVYKNFVISSGCDIPPAAKWENIDAYFNAIEEFYAGKI